MQHDDRTRRGGGKGSTDEGWNGFEEVRSGVAEEETIKQVSRVHKKKQAGRQAALNAYI